MSNDVTSSVVWVLETAAVIKATGNRVVVRKIVYYPAAVDNAVVIKDYDGDGTARWAMFIKAGPTEASPCSLDWGHKGRVLNGFKLESITAGSLHVYLGRDF